MALHQKTKRSPTWKLNHYQKPSRTKRLDRREEDRAAILAAGRAAIESLPIAKAKLQEMKDEITAGHATGWSAEAQQSAEGRLKDQFETIRSIQHKIDSAIELQSRLDSYRKVAR